MSTTMKDVAQRAGVSVATVSRVFNDKGQVSDGTRERVVDAARALSYAPDGAARSLKTRKTETLGALLPDLHGEFFTEIIRGIDQTARSAGYHLLTSGSHDDEDELAAMLRALRGRVDGLLIMSSSIGAEVLNSLLPPASPVLLMGAGTEADLPCGVFEVDNFRGAYAMVSHLTEHGHERIATITGPQGSRDATERLRGYRAALRDAGVTQDAALELEGDFLQPTGHRLAQKLLRLSPRPTALFAANDSMAMGALSALHEAGVHVPADMAVAGFDDIPTSRYMTPSLSTVRVPVCEMGRRAAELLIEAIREDHMLEGRTETFPTTLKLRASCGCTPNAPAANVPSAPEDE